MKSSLSLLVLLGLSGAALAQQQSHPSAQDVDTNNDGMISQDEAGAIEGLVFAEVDTNQDGSISYEEYDAWAAGN